MPKYRIACAALVTAMIAACSSSPPAGEDASRAHDLTPCEDPRPQICTAQYDPVCGLTGDGTFKTYATDCTACSDPGVSGHRPGECE